MYTVSNINAPGMQQYALDISNLSEGTYLLEFKNGEYTQMKKFIKIK
ncbi:MAG: T9SS type A sorting domain-containing protein [Bacteroidota bacterium]